MLLQRNEDTGKWFTHKPDPKILSYVFHKIIYAHLEFIGNYYEDAYESDHPYSQWTRELMESLEDPLEITPPLEDFGAFITIEDPVANFSYIEGEKIEGFPSLSVHVKLLDPELYRYKYRMRFFADLWASCYHECMHLSHYLDNPSKYEKLHENYKDVDSIQHPLEVETVAYSCVMDFLHDYIDEVGKWGREGFLENINRKYFSPYMLHYLQIENEELQERNKDLTEKLLSDPSFPNSIAASGWKNWFRF